MHELKDNNYMLNKLVKERDNFLKKRGNKLELSQDISDIIKNYNITICSKDKKYKKQEYQVEIYRKE